MVILAVFSAQKVYLFMRQSVGYLINTIYMILPIGDEPEDAVRTGFCFEMIFVQGLRRMNHG